MIGATTLVALALLVPAFAARSAIHRALPSPGPGHPGNIFLAGEPIRVSVAEAQEAGWVMVDYGGDTVARGNLQNGVIEPGRLATGYYEIRIASAGGTKSVSVGVIERLRSPTPLTSPICVDAAAAWLVPPPKIQATASLAAMAGVNWVRDRLNWEELEPSRGQFAASNRYDFSVAAQASAGLRVLEVSHRSPKWAAANPERFPDDLRDVYAYHRELAKRWRATVGAFEPWNEADITMFGGHTGSEMAALQKAAYLGLKAGNPAALACLNVFALHRKTTLADLAENEAWPYFDTFNLHHYESFEKYPQVYADFRAVSAGKPLWVTECSVPVKWSGDPALKEPTPEDLRVQSERLPKTFALALHEGAAAVFYFILPNFTEGQTQFGILRPDLSPRPAYVALAAAGRLLADARPLGRIRDPAVQGYAFRAKPDGKEATVLVLWCATGKPAAWTLPLKNAVVFDHLGRARTVAGPKVELTGAPVYVVFRSSPALDLDSPPKSPPREPGRVSPLVLQPVIPKARLLLEQSAYSMGPGTSLDFHLCVYNLGSGPARGVLEWTVPEGWTLESATTVEVKAGARLELPVRATSPESMTGIQRLKVRFKDAKSAGAVASVRLAPKN